MPHIDTINPRKVMVTRNEVRLFNASWPCSTLNPNRAYWFEFDDSGDLVDTDMPEHTGKGGEAKAMSDDCRDWLMYGIGPDWAE
jgi:hypothetical protein